MRLAEALALRADQQKRLTQVRTRIVANARMQEGDEPTEDPTQLLREYVEIAAALRKLVQQVNVTNSRTPVEQGKTIADAIAERDELKLLAAIHRDLAQAGMARQDRATRSEVKFVSAVNVSNLQKQADDYSKRHRELDVRIQELNWSTELIES